MKEQSQTEKIKNPSAKSPAPPIESSPQSAAQAGNQDRTGQKAKERWEAEGGATPGKVPTVSDGAPSPERDSTKPA